MKKGIPANAIMMPLGAIFAILLVCIAFLILEVNRSSYELSDLMARNGVYQIEATGLQMASTRSPRRPPATFRRRSWERARRTSAH